MQWAIDSFFVLAWPGKTTLGAYTNNERHLLLKVLHDAEYAEKTYEKSGFPGPFIPFVGTEFPGGEIVFDIAKHYRPFLWRIAFFHHQVTP